MPADFPSKVVAVMLSSWRLIGQLWIYLAGGILLAAWLDQALPSSKLQQFFSGNRVPIALAALVGAASPLCTYGTVPVLVQLLQHGVSPAPLLTFLVASSLMNPQLFVFMLGGLGLELALAQLLSVVVLSLAVGTIAGRWEPLTLLNQRTLVVNPASDECETAVTDNTFSWSRFLSQVVNLTESVGLYFVVGIIIAAAVEVFVPADWVVKLLGEEHWYSVLVAGSLGVPFYACGGGAIPWIKVLLDEGMSRGAALAFFLAGPATRVTALAALATVLSRRALFLYVAFVLAGAVGLGYLFNLIWIA
jgi:uncharacterized membrane protein YraQ (UPF0718 family)